MTITTAIHSNAFNFLSFLLKGVDPRTGQYTVSVDMPELKSNRLCGPGLPLQLLFNPLNRVDSGYGLGWNLSLSQYTPQNHMLSLGTGETFKVTGSGVQPIIKEKKIDSFHFYDQGSDTYRVVHKSGRVELLRTGGSDASRVALPVQVFAPSGHSVSLSYAPFRGGQMLETVSDAFGVLLRIERDAASTFVRFHLHPDKGPGGAPLATFEMQLGSEGEVRQILLPTEERASWRFQYLKVFNLLCLSEVQTPVGGRETIEYLDGGHAYPGPARDPLPRVTRHRSYPGFAQPMVEVTYSYTDHNFIGNGAPIGWADDGLDNLYKTAPGYEYGSVETLRIGSVATRSVSRTFNRFHLLTEEVTTQGDCIERVATEYHALDVSFDDQPPQFQLPKAVTTSWTLKSDPTRSRSVVERTAFDEHGNLIEQVQTSGVRETTTWYSKDGEEGCPPDPQGFVRQMKEKTTWPAPSEHGQALALRVRYRYRALPALTASDAQDWLVQTEEVLTSSEDAHATPLKMTERDYFNQPADLAVHGLLHRESETLNQQTTQTLYAYQAFFSRQVGETVQEVEEILTGFDGTQKRVIRQHSLLNGEVLLDHDKDTDVQIRYGYDALERITRETVAPDTEFEATRTYQYGLTSGLGQQAFQQSTDVNGVITRTQLDGLNRVVFEERQDADGAQPGQYRRTYAAAFDELGHAVQETEYDWLGTAELVLRHVYDHDDWGERFCETGPDGVQLFSQTDPIGTPQSIGPITRTWQRSPARDLRGEGVIETWLNLFDKPWRVERLGAQGQRVSLHRYLYDGLGRTAEEFDGRDARTQYRYDAFGRAIETVLADDTRVERSYAAHSTQDLPTRIAVNGVELGRQVFDGLDRRIESVVGGRVQAFDYEPGQSRPSGVTTPAAEQIAYDYQPLLHDEPLRRYLPQNLTARYNYDAKNARLLECQESDQELARSYFSTGKLKTESRRQAGGDLLTMHYEYSRAGRLLEYTDVLGQTQHCRYDTAGRLEATDLGDLTATFTYDALGRLRKTHTLADGRSLDVSLEYDDLGREVLRTFNLDGNVQTLTQTWNAVDAVERRTLKEGSQTLRDETYQYDLRGRLEIYTCAGSQPPVDPYGQIIQQQVFIFDALDNMTLVLTTSPSGTDRARFTYGAEDPAQLRRITHSDTAHYPAQIDLDYDANGNLIHDEQQRILTYDALNRLLTVEQPTGEGQRQFRYDPVDRLAGAGPQDEQRFYREDNLATRLTGSTRSTYVRGDGLLLAEKLAGATTGSVLLACDAHQTVLTQGGEDQSANDVAYTPYGWRNAASPMVTDLAFNGELVEEPSAWQVLGNGYRAFNPVLMRFNSPDDLSPFDEGGLNAYAYCEGDPVNHADPSGHLWGAFSGILVLLGVGTLVGAGQVKDNRGLRTTLGLVGGMLIITGVGTWMTMGMGHMMASKSSQSTFFQRNRAASLGSVGSGSSIANPAKTVTQSAVNPDPAGQPPTVQRQAGNPPIPTKRQAPSGNAQNQGTDFSPSPTPRSNVAAALGQPPNAPILRRKFPDRPSILPANIRRDS